MIGSDSKVHSGCGSGVRIGQAFPGFLITVTAHLGRASYQAVWRHNTKIKKEHLEGLSGKMKTKSS